MSNNISKFEGRLKALGGLQLCGTHWKCICDANFELTPKQKHFITSNFIYFFTFLYFSFWVLSALRAPRRGHVRRRSRSVWRLQQQKLPSPGALQEHYVAREAAVVASGSVARAFFRPQRQQLQRLGALRSILWFQKQELQRPVALQERSMAPEAAVAASRSVAGRCSGQKAAIAASRSVALQMLGLQK